MEEQELNGNEIDLDIPLAQEFKRKKKSTSKKGKPPALPVIPEAAAAEQPRIEASSDIVVSEFDFSVENHFKAVNKIAELCRNPENLDNDEVEIQRLSNSITFLKEWRDFNYAPRVVKFACQHNLKEKDVIGEVTLPQFSSATVPKRETPNGSKKTGIESSKDFVMNVGGAIWAFDWCPRLDQSSENCIKSEFVAIAAHPPESSYHKIGVPLTGRGAVQIWCLLTVSMKEDVSSHWNKKPRRNSQKNAVVKSNEPTKTTRPRGRPRKKPLNDSVENIHSDSQFVQPLAVEYPACASALHSSDRTSGNIGEHVGIEESGQRCNDPNQTEHANMLLLTAPEGIGSKMKGRKRDQVHSNGESMVSDKNIACITSSDAKASNDFIPKDVALPRMMLCLAHNGKVAWDVKWRPFNASDPGSNNKMGYLAVLLGNGALEVWEVPLPHAVKRVYPACQEHTDPRFIKLRPVFRCSMLKCGDRQSIPLTMEWSVASPHDMILAGCHDGLVALWKFSITGSSTETSPLLSFSADTGPIRTLAWAPIESDPDGANIIVAGGHKGFKFWDIRDPFRPLWEHPIQGVNNSLDWLPDPRCLFGTVDDGTLWLLSLVKTSNDIPTTGKSATSKQGIHTFNCSSFSLWSVQASRLTGMVAYCGEEGTIHCFQLATRSVTDTRNRLIHCHCGSLVEEESSLIVVSPSPNDPFSKRTPNMKRESSIATNKESPLCKGEASKGVMEAIEVFPPKIVAMHKVRWNVNKGSERWLCYGGAAGLMRCQEVDLSVFQ